LCKNFGAKGNCKYGDKCTFAHGEHELRGKPANNNRYKTKKCKQFHTNGHCSFGSRCQYLHTNACEPDELAHKWSEIEASMRQIMAEAWSTQVYLDAIVIEDESLGNRRRLPAFEMITKHGHKP
jgi:hypothetical protein